MYFYYMCIYHIVATLAASGDHTNVRWVVLSVHCCFIAHVISYAVVRLFWRYWKLPTSSAEQCTTWLISSQKRNIRTRTYYTIVLWNSVLFFGFIAYLPAHRWPNTVFLQFPLWWKQTSAATSASEWNKQMKIYQGGYTENEYTICRCKLCILPGPQSLLQCCFREGHWPL